MLSEGCRRGVQNVSTCVGEQRVSHVLDVSAQFMGLNIVIRLRQG
jgi:hypothetical protein